MITLGDDENRQPTNPFHMLWITGSNFPIDRTATKTRVRIGVSEEEEGTVDDIK